MQPIWVGHLYEHETVFELLDAVVGFPKMPRKAKAMNEIRRKIRKFMRMNAPSDLTGRWWVRCSEHPRVKNGERYRERAGFQEILQHGGLSQRSGNPKTDRLFENRTSNSGQLN